MTETPKNTRPDLAPIDFTKPFWITFDQSAKTRSVETFTGPDAHNHANNYAKERMEKTGRMVAVFGPQCAVWRERPAEAEQVDLAELWNGKDEGVG